MKAATAGLLQLCALSLSFSLACFYLFLFLSLYLSRSISHVNHRTFHCKLRAASDIDKCIVIRRIGIDIVHLHSSPTPSPFNCCLFAYINTSRTWEYVCVYVCAIASLAMRLCFLSDTICNRWAMALISPHVPLISWPFSPCDCVCVRLCVCLLCVCVCVRAVGYTLIELHAALLNAFAIVRSLRSAGQFECNP